MKRISPRLLFAGALAVYLGWVAVLAVMACTSATRPRLASRPSPRRDLRVCERI